MYNITYQSVQKYFKVTPATDTAQMGISAGVLQSPLVGRPLIRFERLVKSQVVVARCEAIIHQEYFFSCIGIIF